MVPQRITYKGFMKKSGALNTDINTETIVYVRRSNGNYKAALEKERPCQTKGQKVQRGSD